MRQRPGSLTRAAFARGGVERPTLPHTFAVNRDPQRRFSLARWRLWSIGSHPEGDPSRNCEAPGVTLTICFASSE